MLLKSLLMSALSLIVFSCSSTTNIESRSIPSTSEKTLYPHQQRIELVAKCDSLHESDSFLRKSIILSVDGIALAVYTNFGSNSELTTDKCRSIYDALSRDLISAKASYDSFKLRKSGTGKFSLNSRSPFYDDLD